MSKAQVYFIGIGGIGTSALARWFLSQNWAVFGSDVTENEITKELRKEGVKIKIGHKKENISRKIDLVIRSFAVNNSNPEVVRAKELKLPILYYPEAVGCLTRAYKTIAIAGAHGKSTTTALVSLILIEANLDPTVIIGTKLREFGNKNFKLGESGWLVLEADEYKGAFLNYSPAIGGVTNVDREHLDFYKNFRNIKKAFKKFKKNCKKVVRPTSNKAVVKKIKSVLKIPGKHNVKNALLAYSVAHYLKIPEKVILRAIGKFRGTWRRMEYKGKLKIRDWKLEIYDDYAHHPTEIKATLGAFREKFSKSKIICVFQPHQAERLNLLFKDFVDAFSKANILILLPSYAVVGRERSKLQIPNSKSAKDLYKAIKKKYPKREIYYLGNPKKLKNFLSKIQKPKTRSLKSILIMMGAGDIYRYTKLLINKK